MAYTPSICFLCCSLLALSRGTGMGSFPYQVLLILKALSCLLESEEGCSLKTPLNGCTLIPIEIAVKNFQHEVVLSNESILTMTLPTTQFERIFNYHE